MELKEQDWIYALVIIILLVMLTIFFGIFYFDVVFNEFSATGYAVLKEAGPSGENATLQENAKEDGLNILKLFFKSKDKD